ncbi:DUF1080 domain-containing protein [Luteolibacter algae]|uniref:DUF1080 domain-containing protein n=1 Tax=Luteolibacter algae TaxID=454151 RepID=A0ABW5D3X1_9BACT
MKLKTLALLLVSAVFANAAPEPLFDGKTLDGWKVEGADYWQAKDGVIVGQSDEKKQGSILWTTAEYKDFVLETDFRFEGDVDSGIFLRSHNEQIQIGVSRSQKRDLTGSPYIGSKKGYPQEAQGVAELLKDGEWNHFKITVKGNVYTVELNGTEVCEYVSDSAKKLEGPIGLQIHAGVVMGVDFRNITLSSL